MQSVKWFGLVDSNRIRTQHFQIGRFRCELIQRTLDWFGIGMASKIVMVAMAVTDKAGGSKGISAFVVEHGTRGMRAGKKEDKLGMRASDTSELLFEKCRVPADHIVGVTGHGFVDAMQVLDAGRIGRSASTATSTRASPRRAASPTSSSCSRPTSTSSKTPSPSG